MWRSKDLRYKSYGTNMKDKKVCHRVRKLLSLYLDGELNPKESKRIGDHLDQCQECTSELEQLSLIKHTAQSLERYEPPDYLFYRIKNEIAKQAKVKSERIWVVRRKRWVLVPTIAAVLVAIGLAIIFKTKEPSPMVELVYQSYRDKAIASLQEYEERLRDLNAALDDCQAALRVNPGNRQVLKAILTVYNEEVKTIDQIASYGR